MKSIHNTSFLASAAVAGLLSGCAAVYPSQPPTVAQLLDNDPTAQCLDTLNRDPRLSRLQPKVGSLRSAGEASLPMLSSSEMPSAEEKTALEWWGNERQRCLGLGSAYRVANMPAPLVASFETGQRDLVMLTARLYSGQLTYGQFNVQRQELASAHRQKYVEFEQQFAAAGGRYGYASGMARTPLYTNCHRFGDVAWNCTSQ
jgi:hypothetical protein